MVSFYIFYHNVNLLGLVRPELKEDGRQKVNYVDLNNLPIPEYMKFNTISRSENKAIYSEYLGLMSIKPDGDMVGCFTYSIPLKFSRSWAEKTGNFDLFLPEITFEKILSRDYEMSRIYGVEFRMPDFEIVRDIHASQLRVGEKTIRPGPFKGSFIVSRKVFIEFQQWLEMVIRYLIEKYRKWNIGPLKNKNSKFSRLSSFKKNDLEMDRKFRHGLGEVLERLTAYYFGQTFKDKEKIKIGPFVNRV